MSAPPTNPPGPSDAQPFVLQSGKKGGAWADPVLKWLTAGAAVLILLMLAGLVGVLVSARSAVRTRVFGRVRVAAE